VVLSPSRTAVFSSISTNSARTCTGRRRWLSVRSLTKVSKLRETLHPVLCTFLPRSQTLDIFQPSLLDRDHTHGRNGGGPHPQNLQSYSRRSRCIRLIYKLVVCKMRFPTNPHSPLFATAFKPTTPPCLRFLPLNMQLIAFTTTVFSLSTFRQLFLCIISWRMD